jgi:hypothetical protein
VVAAEMLVVGRQAAWDETIVCQLSVCGEQMITCCREKMPVPQERAGVLSCTTQPTRLWFSSDNICRLAGGCVRSARVSRCGSRGRSPLIRVAAGVYEEGRSRAPTHRDRAREFDPTKLSLEHRDAGSGINPTPQWASDVVTPMMGPRGTPSSSRPKLRAYRLDTFPSR